MRVLKYNRYPRSWGYANIGIVKTYKFVMKSCESCELNHLDYKISKFPGRR
jgi:hypothetical protein